MKRDKSWYYTLCLKQLVVDLVNKPKFGEDQLKEKKSQYLKSGWTLKQKPKINLIWNETGGGP